MIVKKVNAFTDSINGGNPAGVVLNPSKLTPKQMKNISKQLVVSETAFVYPSKKADFKLRFFTPTIEVDLCGHATIATFFTMGVEGVLPKNKSRVSITQETNSGILPVDIYFKDNQCQKVMMTQSKPVIKNVKINVDEIASALKITKDEIDESLPMQIVSTGLYTLPICVNSFDTLEKIRPDFDKIKKICIEIESGSFHVYTFETLEENSIYHARNFPPCYGINEDPVTGTANGAVSSYLLINNIIKEKKLICEQGDIIGRPGRVLVEIEENNVRVGGKAKLALEIEM